MVERKIYDTGWAALGFKSYKDYLNSEWWQNKRDTILRFKSSVCEKCGSKKQLNVHHIHYENVGNESCKDVIVLCKKCHEVEHGLGD